MKKRTPTDTPFSTMIGSETCSARVFEFLEETSLRYKQSNKVAGGCRPKHRATLSNAVSRTNKPQILTKAFQVSKTADAVKTYARAKETAYQLGKALKEIKRDLERAYVGIDNAAVTGSSSGQEKWHPPADDITTVDAGATPPMLLLKLNYSSWVKTVMVTVLTQAYS